MNKLRNTISGRFNHIRSLYVQFGTIGKKCICIIFGDFHNRLVLSLSTFKHLIFPRISITCKMSYIGNIHYALYIISLISESLLKHILHNVTSEITDMREMINSRSACIHRNFAIRIRNKLFDFSGKSIKQLHFIFHFSVSPIFLKSHQPDF